MGNKDTHPPILVQKYLNGSGRFTRSVLVRQNPRDFADPLKILIPELCTQTLLLLPILWALIFLVLYKGFILELFFSKGPFKCYVTQMGVGVVRFSGKKRYEGVRFNVISVTRGWVGVLFPGKKRYVTLEWPLVVEFTTGYTFTPYVGYFASYGKDTR